jgi:hypothetical protein
MLRNLIPKVHLSSKNDEEEVGEGLENVWRKFGEGLEIGWRKFGEG